MTAPRAEVNITPERIRWFADYYRAHPSWGVFHVCLADGNYKIGAAEERFSKEPYSEELREAIAWFERLSPAQRARLGIRAEDMAHTVVR